MGIAARVGFGAVALAALAVIAIPLGGAAAIDRSRDAAIAGQVPDALTAADDAAAIQPYAATPDLQRALLLESQGRFAEAAAAARAATAGGAGELATVADALAAGGRGRQREGGRRGLSRGARSEPPIGDLRPVNDRDDMPDRDLAPLDEELREAKPLPSPAVRSRIRAMIAEAGPLRGRPDDLHGMVALYALAGVLLLIVAVLGAVGAGPL